jgi:hypothetical protein
MAPTSVAAFTFVALLLCGPLAHATPKAGSRELRIGQQYQPSLQVSDGFLRHETGGNGVTTLGAGFGFGAFLTDHVELGLSASLSLAKLTGRDDALVAFGLEPFLRLMKVSERTGYFGELILGAQRLSVAGDGVSLFEVGLDVGLEYFVTDSWAVRFSPGYRRLMDSDGDGVNRFGITWGLACYY